MKRRQQQEDKHHLHDLTVDVPDLIAHGKPDDFVIGVVHDEHLVHTEHLSGFHVSQSVAMLAVLEGDGLTPLVRPGVGGLVRQGHFIVPSGG